MDKIPLASIYQIILEEVITLLGLKKMGYTLMKLLDIAV
tara:strand:- start:1437 stop:1553 length:117 start_codon:yes stop_codon:yes gene_type:complete